jgi:hypothetical protein
MLKPFKKVGKKINEKQMKNLTLALQGSNKMYANQAYTNSNGSSITLGDTQYGMPYSRLRQFAKAALYNKDLVLYRLEDGVQVEALIEFNSDWKLALRLLTQKSMWAEKYCQ